MHLGILLLLHSLETFKIYNEDRRAFEYLELLNSLLVHFASAAKPGVLVRQLFWGRKLSKAVINSHLIILKQVKGLSFSSLLREVFTVLFKPHHILIESPALISIERNLKFKFQVVSLLLLLRSA